MIRELTELAGLIRQRNAVARRITSLICRPARLRHVGEFIASRIFHIKLASAANQSGFDGWFCKGPLKEQTVNIKWYVSHEHTLQIATKHRPDYFLVLTGPMSPAPTSHGQVHPWVIDHVFLFDARNLVKELTRRGVKFGTATSIARHLWENAEIYPARTRDVLHLSREQRTALSLFGLASHTAAQ